MTRLSQLVYGFTITPPGVDPEIVGLSEDSRRIAPGMLFVAVPGTALDGHAYIGEAVARGAAAIVAERTGAIPAGVPVVRVPSSRDALALLAARFFNTTSTTSTPLSLIGFTGTLARRARAISCGDWLIQTAATSLSPRRTPRTLSTNLSCLCVPGALSGDMLLAQFSRYFCTNSTQAY